MALSACLRSIPQHQGNSTHTMFSMCKLVNRTHNINRTLPSSLLHKITIIHKFHSSAIFQIPRGVRASSALVKKSRLHVDDLQKRNSDHRDEAGGLASKDAALSGTYIVGRESNLTSRSRVDKGQVGYLDNGSNEPLWDSEGEDYEMQERKSFDSPLRLEDDLSNSDENYMKRERNQRRNLTKEWSEQRRTGNQQWKDESLGRDSSSSDENYIKRERNQRRNLPHQKRSEQRRPDNQQWEDQSKPENQDISLSRKITVPKMSEAFQFSKSDEMLHDQTSQRSRKEKNNRKEKRAKKDLSRESERQRVDESWFAQNTIHKGNESGVDESKVHRTRTSQLKSSEVANYANSDDLLQVDAEWTSYNKLQEESKDGSVKKKGWSEKIEERRNLKKQKHERRVLQDIPAAGNEILFGIAPCWLALQRAKRVIHHAYISPSFQDSDRNEAQSILAAIENQVEIKVVHRNELDRLTGQRPHQGVCLETSPLELFTLSDREDVLDAQLESLHQKQPETSQNHSVWLALDQIKDPMNFGAVLRSSYFLGVDRVITCVANSCPLSPVVSKASSGVMEVLDVYAASDMPLVLQSMSSLGWQVIGACSSTFASANQDNIESVPCHQYNITQPTVLVIGNEGYGLRSKVRTSCSKFLTIESGRELHPGIDSLNVSVATGILLHSLLGARK